MKLVHVSVLFNEPKLLKCKRGDNRCETTRRRFSALQRAEIAEIYKSSLFYSAANMSFSALQRAEIAEMRGQFVVEHRRGVGFSALQRAEIAEIGSRGC